MSSSIYEFSTYLLIVIVAALAILVLREFRKHSRGKSGGKSIEKTSEISSGIWPLSTSKSVPAEEVRKAKEKIRTLDIEREIQSYAIRRLYEAQTEGNLTPEERERLSTKYKDRLRSIKEDIARGESIIALNELESMQEELVDLFNRRFDDLNKKIGEIRLRTGVDFQKPSEKPKSEKKTSPAAESKPKADKRKKGPERLPNAPTKSEADEKIERIMTEVEKALDRLEQMEVEG